MTDAAARFGAIQAQLPLLLDALLACPPYKAGVRPAVPHNAGVYLFTENGRHLYVGRTRNCNARLGQHTRVSPKENSAPFAFNLAKRAAQKTGVHAIGTRLAVSAREEFDALFRAAKAQVRAMEFRFVPIDDPALSTIFEVYASIALGTEGEFNLFETH
jgi:hypothetical protein